MHQKWTEEERVDDARLTSLFASDAFESALEYADQPDVSNESDILSYGGMMLKARRHVLFKYFKTWGEEAEENKNKNMLAENADTEDYLSTEPDYLTDGSFFPECEEVENNATATTEHQDVFTDPQELQQVLSVTSGTVRYTT